MQNKITKRQKEILQYIYSHFQTDGFPPSFEELKDKFDISSNQAIIDHLNSLEKKGLIKRGENQARGLRLTPLGCKSIGADQIIPVVGGSYAGPFVQTIELQGEWLKTSSEVHEYKSEVFIIEVHGDSMINAGIFDGDKLLVQTQEHFKSGDIVLAQRNEGSTVKKFIRQNKPPFISLRPENPKYSHISFTDDVKMKGKVIAKWEAGTIKSLIQGRFL